MRSYGQKRLSKRVTTSLLVLPDGRTIEHPETVARGDLLELEDGCLYYVEAAAAGTKRATGETITLARLSKVRD